jgi:inosose dehydratase
MVVVKSRLRQTHAGDPMKATVNRRNFSKAMAAGLSAAAVPTLRSAQSRKIKIGYTCLTWNATPRTPENLEPALKDVSGLGFYSFETFAEVLAAWDEKGELGRLIEQYKIPLTSGYLTTNLMDPAAKKETLEKITRVSKVIKKHGGNFCVLAPNSVKRAEYKFEDHRANIVSMLNDYAMAVNDVGLGAGLHQHTGTCIESRDEVYAVMEAVNTKHVKFAPDVGQLQKGGADAAKVVKDFLPLLRHMHLKDYSGGEHFSGYCPLGQGKVDIAGILDMVERASHPANIMVELDRAPNTPITALETAQTTKAYLEKLGYKFRS